MNVEQIMYIEVKTCGVPSQNFIRTNSLVVLNAWR